MKKNLKLKKYMSVILPAVLCMSSVNNVWAEQSEQRVISIQIESNMAIINGESVELGSVPYLDSYNNTMVPVMFIASALNIPDENIEYNTESRKVTIKFNGEVLSFFMGDFNIYKTLADNTMTMHTMQNNAVAVLKDDVIFIPIRSIAEIFDITVGWDDNTKMVTLTSGSSEVSSINEVNQLQEVGLFEEITQEIKDPTRQYEEEVVRLINIERAKYELEPLVIYEPAMDLSREKSQHMSDNNYFSHRDPVDGSLMFQQLSVASAESIAVNQDTPQELVEHLMASEDDRANILSAYSKGIGVGLAYGNNQLEDSKYWTQIYVTEVISNEQAEVQYQDIHIQNVGVSFEQSNPFINESTPIGTYVVPTISVGESQSMSQDDYMNEVALMLMNSAGQNLLTQELTQQSNVTIGNERVLAEQAINLINAERTKEGLTPLQIYEPAMSVAQSRAEDMAVRNYTTTLSPEGVSLNTIVSKNYGQRTSSNVANYVTSAKDALDFWMSFTPNNLLSYEYEYIGLGYSNSRWAYVLIGKMYNN